jgi:C1A family cysteine protease
MVFNEINGIISPGGEERIVAEELAAGRLSEIIPAERTSDVVLPAYFDRSTDKAFPPIGSQRGGSCTGWATTYYSATFQVADRDGWDAQNGGREYNMSPHWTYNFINNGKDAGGSMTNNNKVMIQHGIATWKDFPEGDPNRATSWCTDPAVWRKAIPYRMESQSSIRDVNTPAGLETLKELVMNSKNGITFGTNSPSSGKHWVWTPIKDNPSSTVDDPFVGETACYYVKSNQGGRHALSVCGWNDDIWVDVNQNGSIDDGEIGALKIPESHGTNAGNKGFYWLAYDALHPESQVENGPNSDRSGAFGSQRAGLEVLRDSYTPKMFAEFTLQTAARIDVVLTFLRAKTTDVKPFSNPLDSWKGYVFGTMYNSADNRLGFDGEDYSSNPSDAPEGTFVFDLTDIIPESVSPDDMWRYVMKVEDREQGMPVTVKSFKVIVPYNNNDSVYVSQNTPVTVDDDIDYVWVDVPDIPIQIITGVTRHENTPLRIEKISNRRVAFTVNASGKGEFLLQVYTTAGKRLWEYRNESAEAGTQQVHWDLNGNSSTGLGNGLYLVSLVRNNTREVKRFHFVK